MGDTYIVIVITRNVMTIMGVTLLSNRYNHASLLHAQQNYFSSTAFQ
jgi:hypothetical protein